MAQMRIHPGEHLALELEELGMSASELARYLSVPPNRITAILKGQRSITGDTALRLAHFFGTSPEFWLNLQNLYEIRVAQQQAGRAISAFNVEGPRTQVRLKRTKPPAGPSPPAGAARPVPPGAVHAATSPLPPSIGLRTP